MSGWLEKFSSIEKIIRILAYIHRWKSNAHLNRNERRHAWLSVPELAAGRKYLLQLVQVHCFKPVISALESKRPIPKTSPILRLAPIVKDGLLRVGGRLQHSHLPESEKHQVIMPNENHVTILLIQHAHRVTLHEGTTAVQSYLIREFWIIKAKKTIRSVIPKCVKCVRKNARTTQQMMGPLPSVKLR